MSDAARAIAARLTPAQRRALMWLPANGQWCNPLLDIMPETVDREMDALVSDQMAVFAEAVYAVAITPLGLAVRAILAEQPNA